MSKMTKATSQDVARTPVGPRVTYERLSRSRYSLSVWTGDRLRHQDTVDITVAARRQAFAAAAAGKLGIAASEIEDLLLEAAGEIEVAAAAPRDAVDPRPVLSNASADGPGLAIGEIEEDLLNISGGWPKRVGDRLFVATPDLRPRELGGATQLFAWIDGIARVVWAKGADKVREERFYEHLRATVEAFDAVEPLPHWPPRPGAFYLHPALPGPGPERLDELVDFFSPATPEDRHLIKAMWATPAWGGGPGKRPAFLILGPEEDAEKMGRGVGKSTVTEMLARLYGGYLDVSPNSDIDKIKTRLLSPEARGRRVARLDNVKSHHFSWGDLENLITAERISGHEMYRGEGVRTNTLTWLVTLNGAALSKDLALRVVTINLARPEYDPDWANRVGRFIDAHSWEILRDVGSYLESPGADGYRPATRWSEWEAGVLAKGRRPVACRKLILSRQALADADAGERELVAGEFRKELAARSLDPDRQRYFIPSRLAAEWLDAATRARYATNRATVHLKMLGIAELIPDQKSDGRVGWEWRGRLADPKGPRRTVKEGPPPTARGFDV